jgi:hypothetical protein
MEEEHQRYSHAVANDSSPRFPLEIELVSLAQKQSIVRIRHRYALPQNLETEYAFRLLGASASNAVPELIRIYEANVSPWSQRCTALALGSIGRPAKAAIPVLLRNFVHTNEDVRFYAVSAVYYIGGEPETVVPALKSVLKDPRKGTRWNAALALGNFGSRARSVVPDLVQTLQDDEIKEQVEKTLWSVAPDVIAKPCVVEEATPMITNGVTAQTLGRNFAGKWVSLIPAGRPVATAAYQGWGSDQGSQLEIRFGLYRGSGKTLNENHFLGEFEVVDIPASRPYVHVQIAYLIVSNRIVLCAYEDRGRTFLEIRRTNKERTK